MLENVFCPTGPGGGVDASCSPGGTSTPIASALPSTKEWTKELKKIFAEEWQGTLYEKHQFEESHGEGICTPASYRLQKILKERGIETEVIDGEYVGPIERKNNASVYNHTWLKTKDGTVIDGTEAQFTPKAKLGTISVYQAGSAGAKKYKEGQWGVANVFCPTGEGGGIDATCSPGGSAQSTEDKSKFIGQIVGTKEVHHAARMVKAVARAVGGKVTGDTKPKDVEAQDREGTNHGIEVKSLLKGNKQRLSVHPDALMRKMDDRDMYGITYHTVAIDERRTYDGGEHRDNYSGHRIYYKRGCGRYSLSKMHEVDSMEQLRELIATPDKDLPEKAQGDLPRGNAAKAIRVLAKSAAEARRTKDEARKQRLKDQGSSAYERRT